MSYPQHAETFKVPKIHVGTIGFFSGVGGGGGGGGGASRLGMHSLLYPSLSSLPTSVVSMYFNNVYPSHTSLC